MLEVNPLDNAIRMDRGDYFDPKFTITDAAGLALDVSAATFKLTTKASIDDAIGSAIFQLTTVDFDLAQAASGIIVAKGPETLTQALAGDYVYDLEMILASKTRTVVRAASLQIDKDVSTPGSAPAPPAPVIGFTLGLAIEGGALYIRTAVADGGPGTYSKYQEQSDGLGGFILTKVGSGSASYPF